MENGNLIEARTGREQHSSAWGDFFTHGLDLVKEGGESGRHESYTDRAGFVQDGTLFTIWHRCGDKNGTTECDYYICQADSAEPEQEIKGGCYGRGGWVRGRFTILAHGDGKVRGPRLLGWVKERGGIENINTHLARHWGAEINKRGTANPSPLTDADTGEVM